MRLFLDANVLFAACWSPTGRSGLLLHLARAGEVELCSSPYALEEVRRNLELKRPEALADLDRSRHLVATVAEGSPALVSMALRSGLPPEDAPILAAAVAAGADALVTGDRTHFGHLYDTYVAGVLVLCTRDAIARVLDG